MQLQRIGTAATPRALHFTMRSRRAARRSVRR
jgi:hypothetical protein